MLHRHTRFVIMFCAMLIVVASTPVSGQPCPECCPTWFNQDCGLNVTDESFDRQWALDAINVCEAWSLGYTGQGIVVGVVDGGILEYHPDLVGQIEPVVDGCSEVRPDFTFCLACVLEDSHGTLLAGIIAALKNNPDTGLGWNMVGVAPDARLAEVFIYDDWGGDPKRIEEHVQVIGFKNDCIDVKVHAYDLRGEGGPYSPLPMDIIKAFELAISTGRSGLGQVFVWSSGNGATGGERTDYEELVSSRYSIAVGAVGATFELDQQSGLPIFYFYRPSYSETGASLDCVAPGNNLVKTSRVVRPCFICDPPPYIPSYTSCESTAGGGTSFSAPHVAGVVALMMEANTNLSWRDVMDTIARTAATIDPTSGWQTNQAGIDHSYEYGHGLIDAFEAVSFVTGTNGYPAWEPLLGERQVIVPVTTNSVQVGPGQTVTLPPIAVTANMRLEHVEFAVNITTVGSLGIGPLEIEIERVWPPIIGGRFGQHITQSIFAVARTDPTANYENPDPDSNGNALFTSVRHWRENATATWKVRLHNTSDSKDPVTATWHVAELRFYGTPKCIADWDMDDDVDVFDDIAYRLDHFNGNPWADLNHDQVIDQDDLDLWEFVHYPAGCP